VRIPAGEFQMGAPESEPSADRWERPQHRVRITRPFYLGATEVTKTQYRDVTGQIPSYFNGPDGQPVKEVSWYDAVAFCERLNEKESTQWGGLLYRLPTDAEWEYACRAGSTTRYSFGDDGARLAEYAWTSDNSGGGGTHPVGRKRANAFGLYDMIGNVREWCWDGFEETWYTQSPVDDPFGPPWASKRVVRGSSFFTAKPRETVRSAVRHGVAPDARDLTLGFRLALVRPTPPESLGASAALPASSTGTPAPTTSTPVAGPARTATPDRPGGSIITNSLGMRLVRIAPGEFLMGAPASDTLAQEDEKPQHRVRIARAFWLGAFEVTQRQYRAVTGENPSRFQESNDLPVENVDWNQAVAFCNKLSASEGLKPYYRWPTGERAGGDGYRLPTEAEWEYACRAGSTTRYCTGEDRAGVASVSWFADNSGNDLWDSAPFTTEAGGPGHGPEAGRHGCRSHPVGSKQPNAFGLYDMHGNLWEWCSDLYDADYYRRSPDADPVGPKQSDKRVGRGGSWYSSQKYASSTSRDGYAPGHRVGTLGFRVARDTPARTGSGP
jgi:formylglycine-generating enzyme required for sulfatase activity